MEIAGDDAMTTGTDGTELCLSYSAVLTKQLRNPTDMDRQFAAYLITKWQQYVKHLQLEAEPIFYQHVTLAVHYRLLYTKFVPIDGNDTKVEVQFTYEEENAIRYMGGYVVKNLPKNHDVGFLIDSGEEFQEAESSDWINAIDRGGLVHITDSCYQLFLSIETVTRLKMKATNAVMNDSFLQHLINLINSDNDVLFNWTMITGDESENQEVLGEIVKLWIKTRGFSFAKSIAEKYRQAARRGLRRLKVLGLNCLLMNLIKLAIV